MKNNPLVSDKTIIEIRPNSDLGKIMRRFKCNNIPYMNKYILILKTK